MTDNPNTPTSDNNMPCCANCNSVIPSGARFCATCGTPVNAAEPTPQPVAQAVYEPVSEPVAQPAEQNIYVPVSEPVPQPSVNYENDLAMPDSEVTVEYPQNIEEQVPEQNKKPKKKKLIILSIIIVSSLILLTVATGLVFLFTKPFTAADYNDACALMEAGDYETAYAMFVELEDYSDSRDKAVECNYQLGLSYLDDENYEDAYYKFRDLGDYKESEANLLKIKLLWLSSALGSEQEWRVDDYCSIVSVDNYEDYSAVYNTAVLFVNGHTDSYFWFDDYGSTANTKNVLKVLKLLPVTYEQTSLYLELFDALNSYYYAGDIFINNESTMRQCWSLGLVQDLAQRDDAISEFLLGNWTTWSGDIYLNFYEKDDGISCSYNVPWYDISGVEYYNIEDMTYSVYDKNDKKLKDYYIISIIDYDTITVYAYKNNRTYRMYR